METTDRMKKQIEEKLREANALGSKIMAFREASIDTSKDEKILEEMIRDINRMIAELERRTNFLKSSIN